LTSEQSVAAEPDAEQEDAPPTTAEYSCAIDNMILLIYDLAEPVRSGPVRRAKARSRN